MKLVYSLLPINRSSMQFNIHDDKPAELLCRFDGQMTPIEDVVSLLIQSGMTTEEIGRWLERRMNIGHLAPITGVIQ